MSDVLLDKAVDFTTGKSPRGGETGLLQIWLAMALYRFGLIGLAVAQGVVQAVTDGRGLDADAGRELATGLLVEHYRSVLAADPDEFEPAQSVTLVAQRAAFDAEVAAFLALREREFESFDPVDVRDRPY